MGIYIGIDWSEAKHDIAFLNDAMSVVAQVTIPHSPDGFLKLDATRQALNVPADQVTVGIETVYSLLIDFLWARGYRQVYVLPANVVKSSRRLYRQSGARTDPSDAFLIANLLRTDRSRFQVWCPDSPLTCRMRAKGSWFIHLTRMQVRLGNRLRAVLLRYYPAAVEVFSNLAATVTLEFLCAYPNPQAAQGLTYPQFEAFARQHNYTRLKKLPAAFARVQTPQPEATPGIVAMDQDEVVQQAQLLLTVVQHHSRAERELLKQFQQHPDYDTFHSLPGAGDFSLQHY